jgi:hypothetical protein
LRRVRDPAPPGDVLLGSGEFLAQRRIFGPQSFDLDGWRWNLPASL